MTKTAEAHTDTTRTLLLRLKQGDREAFNAVFRLYSGKVYNTMIKLLNDKYIAEDIVQELFMAIWEKHDRINPDLNFEAYLAVIARNMAYHALEEIVRKTRQRADLDQAAVLPQTDWEGELEAQSFKEYLLQIISRFPSVRKQVFILSRFEHRSHAEIAQQLNISERTVEAHIYKALQELRKILGNRTLLLVLFALSHR